MSTQRPLDRARSLGLLGLLLLLSPQGCGSERIVVVPPDTVAPHLQVTSPHDTLYDLDGDRLLDVSITWADSGGRVRPESVRIRSLDGVNGPADASTNLLSVWRVERLDSSGIVLHETLENLLHGGVNRLEISVADTTGNAMVDTVTFTLPHGAFWKTVPSGLDPQTGRNGVLALDSATHRIYLAHFARLVVFDADSPTVLATVPVQVEGMALNRLLYVPGDRLIYATEILRGFDQATRTWAPEFSGASPAIGLVQSRADPDLLYLGETRWGVIGIYSRAQQARIGSVPYPPVPTNDEYVFDLAVLAGDTKLYATRISESGILALNPTTGEVLKRIDVGGGFQSLGYADALELSRDDTHLYAVVTDGDPRGVADIDTRTDSVVRVLPLDLAVPLDLSLSPDGRQLFVVTQDLEAGIPSSNYLIDVVQWRVVAQFARPRPAGVARYDQSVLFHANGKLVFVARDLDLDVYVIRG